MKAKRKSTRRCKKCSMFFTVNKGDELTYYCPKCQTRGIPSAKPKVTGIYKSLPEVNYLSEYVEEVVDE